MQTRYLSQTFASWSQCTFACHLLTIRIVERRCRKFFFFFCLLVHQKIRHLLGKREISGQDKARLVMLYALRYEKHSSSALAEFIETLFRENVPEKHRSLVTALTRFASSDKPERQSDLFGTKGATGLFKHLSGGLKGVDNIYTQHTPLLSQTLDALAKGKLRDDAYPCLQGAAPARYQDVIVFMVGGYTYEEVKAVEEFNEANRDMRVVLGGTSILNFKSYCRELLKFTAAS
eukprot:m.334315 g.334315  ORF g.334315 m.334315 type:complete len:233 (-) comp16070_c1_seq2:311-1009(-)